MSSASTLRRRIAIKTAEALVALVLLAVILLPLAWLFLISVRPVAEVYAYPLSFWPKTFTFEAYRKVWANQAYNTDWVRYFINTAMISVGAAACVALLGMLFGFILSRTRGPSVQRIQLLFVMVQLFEGPALIIPIYLAMNWLGLYDTRIGYALLLILFFLPFAAMLSLSFAYSVPVELDEAARIDGCSDWQYFYKIFLPVSKVGVITVGLMAFLLMWGEYPFALTLLKGDNRTVSTALVDLITGISVYWNNLAAASTISSIPVILVLIFAQRHIVSGLTMGTGK
jgi:ABC-type glycerol-3-phosphate transport system permease component